jgi:hypothetical protein
MPTHKIQKSRSQAPQHAGDSSFVGGRPALPAGQEIPTCTLCKSKQTFFLQLAFPKGHPWGEQTLAIFACTQCANEEYLIPELLPELKSAKIPRGFLDSYQRNFRFLVFPTRDGTMHSQYKPRVAFRRLELTRAANAAKANKAGGEPNWVMEDESPNDYQGKPMVFLMQLLPGWKFEPSRGRAAAGHRF